MILDEHGAADGELDGELLISVSLKKCIMNRRVNFLGYVPILRKLYIQNFTLDYTKKERNNAEPHHNRE